MDQGLLSPKGILIADNTLFRGLVADRSENNPLSGNKGNLTEQMAVDVRRAELLDEFNKVVRADERVESVMLPVFDGLNLIRLKEGHE